MNRQAEERRSGEPTVGNAAESVRRAETAARIGREKLIVILRGVHGASLLRTAESLCRAGVGLIEYAYDGALSDRENAQDLGELCRQYGKSLSVGAGTVTSDARLAMAAEAGAAYILSPDTDPARIAKTLQYGLLSIPGALTPTEVCRAAEAGADYIKIFPVSVMGAGYLRDLSSPLRGVRMLAVGGITAENAREYLEAGACGVGVGASLVRKEWVEAGRYDRIREEASRLLAALR